VSTPNEVAATTATWAAREALLDALRTVPSLRVSGIGDNLEPPAALVSPPRLVWSLPQSEPTEATHQVVIVVPADDRALERLDALIPLVAAALDATGWAVVRSAEPSTWDAGEVPLPCYLIETEVAL
jgi:hypothetical protein